MKVILASKSPRRKELLSMITNDFEVIVSNVEEKLDKNLTPEEQAKQLSYIKAKAVFDSTADLGDRVVIGGDTIVVKDGKIFGKPKDKEDASNMIKTLKNSKHEVITGISVIYQKQGITKEIIDSDISKVYFTDIDDDEIEKWVSSDEPYDKAGAYAAQGKFGVYFDKIEGNYYNVVGLPIHKVYKILKSIL